MSHKRSIICVLHKKTAGKAVFQTVDKPLDYKKMGCRVLLALLVLHRAKLLASNQSILALGRSPRQGLGAVAPVKSPFPGERGQGDRDNKSEVNFKNRLFLQAERPPERRSCCFMLLVGLGFILVVVMQHSCSFMRFLFNVHL